MTFDNLKLKIKNTKIKNLFIEFLKWKVIDIYRFFKYPRVIHLYGIRCIGGMYGMGKTMAMTKVAIDLRNKYKDNVYICSNYGLGIQDFPFTDVSQTCKIYDKPIVFFWDEVQNDFPAQDKVFPKDLRKALTLNRKGNGKMFYWASQDHELVHKTIRRLTIEFGDVRTFFKRYTIVKWYTKDDYQRLFNSIDINNKIKIRPLSKLKFIQDDFIREQYDSFAWDNGEKLVKISEGN